MPTASIESEPSAKPPRPSDGPEVSPVTTGTRSVCSALFTLGFAARVAPFFDHGGRLLSQFPTEDGYFMLTMARSLSLGQGLSVSGGAVPTNGTQPLATFVWGLAYALVGGDSIEGVAAVLALELVIATLAAYGIFRLTSMVFAHRGDVATLARVAAAVWFGSAIVLPHTMNCLETGLYTAIAVFVAIHFVEPPTPTPPTMSVRRALSLGLLLGLAFWARNDAAFLILGVCLAHLHAGLDGGRAALAVRFRRTLVFGSTSVVVALPWMTYNYFGFGHPIPVSGRAESLGAVFAGNIVHLPAVLFETVSVVVPVPHSVETHPAILVLGALVSIGAAVAVGSSYRDAPRSVRHLTVMVGIYALGLTVFYGLFFGAPWFMGRYLAPLSPFGAILWAVATKTLADRAAPSRRAFTALLAAAFAVSLALNARIYLKGDQHQHFQVVAWVRENVPVDTWVAAVQTGTLGYFHERTINLDGKVNPAAFEALAESRGPAYVVSSEAEYLVDWVGLVEWMHEPEIAAAFEVLVEDPERNLAVLRRRARASVEAERDRMRARSSAHERSAAERGTYVRRNGRRCRLDEVAPRAGNALRARNRNHEGLARGRSPRRRNDSRGRGRDLVRGHALLPDGAAPGARALHASPRPDRHRSGHRARARERSARPA